ncbi:MAG: hypothetical protein IJ524_05770 [Bacteroidales bacterium]|nr:hypothetical protein [Bacteroidales bacterium]
MSYRRGVIMLLMLAACVAAMGQDKGRMAAHERRLSELLERTASAPTDNERYLASEEAVDALRDALDEAGSERWRWTLPRSASVLTSPDGRLRVFTWAVVRDNGEFECFGAVQFFNERTQAYEYEVLHDKSEEIMNREESLLSAGNWLGAIYQDIIQTTAGDRTYYTLLGWNGVDNLTDRRIIEPVMMRAGVPQFGAPVFRRERNLRRVVLEYRGDAAVQMAWDEQTVEEVTRERVKENGRYRTVEKRKEHKEKVIIFDEVEPQIEGMEGLFQYYVPSGLELGYAWVDGKWELRHGAQGRLTDKKLNKSFAPLPKAAPSYEYK